MYIVLCAPPPLKKKGEKKPLAGIFAPLYVCCLTSQLFLLPTHFVFFCTEINATSSLLSYTNSLPGSSIPLPTMVQYIQTSSNSLNTLLYITLVQIKAPELRLMLLCNCDQSSCLYYRSWLSILKRPQPFRLFSNALLHQNILSSSVHSICTVSHLPECILLCRLKSFEL